MLSRPKVVAFDIIETVFQLEPLRERMVAAGLPASALDLWFATGLRDAFALAASGAYAPFRTVLEAALDQVAAHSGCALERDEKDGVLDAMGALPPHPDAAAAFATLAAAGVTIVALSNGGASVTEKLLEAAALKSMVRHIVSTDDVNRAKPHRQVYLHTASTADVAPGELMLVAAHAWDVHGAKSAGLLAAYVNRGNPFPSYMQAPDVEGASLSAVAEIISRAAAGF